VLVEYNRWNNVEICEINILVNFVWKGGYSTRLNFVLLHYSTILSKYTRNIKEKKRRELSKHQVK
jgi:hypothetical protein